MINLKDLEKDEEVLTLLKEADRQLLAIGYTEHGIRHSKLVAARARAILLRLKFPKREAELAAIAGFLHDIGNLVNRERHEESGALIALSILKRLGMPLAEVSKVVSALGNHHEETSSITSPITAALILADKSDVHSSRVRNPDYIKFDIHDRVNYAVKKSELTVDSKKRKIILNLAIDTKIAPIMEYFEIFLSRMLISRRAADFLGCQFELFINGVKVV
ncbi:MAG: HD domain-containing protein [candidate division WOR-3 bacterium]